MRFLPTDHGDIPETQIASICARARKDSSGNWQRTVRLTDGTTTQAWREDIERLEEQGYAVIPASQGAEVIEFAIYDDEEHMERYPVVAWRITPYGAEPITPFNHGLDRCENARYGLALPGDLILTEDERVFHSVADFVRTVREEIQRAEARRRARASQAPTAITGS